MGRWIAAMVLAALTLATAAEAAPARRPRRARAKKPPSAPAGPIQIPIEVGVGPILLVPNPPAFDDQPLHLGIQLELAAVVDQALIRRHRNQIPAWARGIASSVDEVKVRPWWLALVPNTLIISPQVAQTGMYGAIWRPYGIGVPLVAQPGFHLSAGAAIDAVALFVHSTVLGGGSPSAQSATLVLRPGVNLHLTAEVPLGESLRLSGGWASDFFVPQPYGRPPWEIAPLEDSLWHLGGPFVVLAWRFPLEVGAL